MHLTLPIGYEVIGKRPGKRNFRPIRLAEMVTVEIAEATSDEAPIAVEWQIDPTHERMRPATAATYFAGDDRWCAFTRWYGGRHWMRLVEHNISKSDHARHATQLSASRLEEFLMADEGHIAVGLSGLSLGAAKLPKKDGDLTLGFETLRKNGREEAMLAALSLPETLLLVDGIVHVACAQPAPARTMIREYRDGHPPALYNVSMRTDVIALDGYDPDLAKVLAYGIEDWDRLNAQRADGLILPPPAVLVPDSIDPGVEARRAVSNLVKIALAQWGCPAFMRTEFNEFLKDTTSQRYERLSGILTQAGPTFMDRERQLALLEAVERIEDGMAVETAALANPSMRF